MIEKRRKAQNISYSIESQQDDDFSDETVNKKSFFKSTSPLSLFLTLLVLTILVVYMANIDVRNAITHSSAYKVGNSFKSLSNELALAVNVDNSRPTIVHQHLNIVTESPDIRQVVERHEEAMVREAVANAPEPELGSLLAEANKQISLLSSMKREQHIVMEKDEEALRQIAVLQRQLRTLIPLQYGSGPYVVEMRLKFPASMLKDPALPEEEIIRVLLAPIDLVPYSVFYFLRIVTEWKGGAFHRNAGHVLQAQVRSSQPGLAFQEYHPGYPHKQYTLGYAGRPGGPAFYISTVDNTANHGPASQGSASEADGCFGQLADEASIQVVKRMQKQPGGQKGSGFMLDAANNIKIVSMTLLNHP